MLDRRLLQSVLAVVLVVMIVAFFAYRRRGNKEGLTASPTCSDSRWCSRRCYPRYPPGDGVASRPLIRALVDIMKLPCSTATPIGQQALSATGGFSRIVGGAAGRYNYIVGPAVQPVQKQKPSAKNRNPLRLAAEGVRRFLSERCRRCGRPASIWSITYMLQPDRTRLPVPLGECRRCRSSLRQRPH